MPGGEIVKSSREVPVLLRKYRQPLYDEEKVGAGVATASMTLFAKRRGETDAANHTKTTRDTNMTQSGALGSKQEFYFVGINVKLDWSICVVDLASAVPNNVSNELYVIEQILNDSLFSFTFGRQQPLLEIPMDQIPAGVGPAGDISTNYTIGTAAIAHIINNGVPSCREFYDVRLRKNRPRHIQRDQAFTVDIAWLNDNITLSSSSLDAYYRIMVYLLGILLSNL